MYLWSHVSQDWKNNMIYFIKYVLCRQNFARWQTGNALHISLPTNYVSGPISSWQIPWEFSILLSDCTSRVINSSNKNKNTINFTIFIFSCLLKGQLISTKRNYVFSTFFFSRKTYHGGTNLRHSSVVPLEISVMITVKNYKVCSSDFSNLPWPITVIWS